VQEVKHVLELLRSAHDAWQILNLTSVFKYNASHIIGSGVITTSWHGGRDSMRVICLLYAVSHSASHLT